MYCKVVHAKEWIGRSCDMMRDSIRKQKTARIFCIKFWLVFAMLSEKKDDAALNQMGIKYLHTVT
jgi:hypothetical protein